MRIHLIKNQPNIHYNIKCWKKSDCPLLLITGLSGSGKTTYAKKIAQKNNAILVSFDVLKFYNEASEDSKKILDIFLESYPQIQKLIQTHWKKTDNIYTNDKLYNYYCNIFFDFLIEYSKKQSKRIILEGIQIFVRLHPSKTVKMPLIIVGSSCFKSSKNKFKRDFIEAQNKFSLYKYMHQLYLYHIKQYFDINKFILYYRICDLNINFKG